MLTVYRRHNPKRCPHNSRSWRRCSCPLWCDGSLIGRRYNKSLATRNWETAQGIVQKMEATGQPQSERITIEDATDSFLRDATARGLREPSIYKYRLLFRQLKNFAADKGMRFLTECDIDRLREFRESWPNKNFSARKKLEALKTSFKFFHDSGYLPDNPAAKIKPPKIDDVPTLPFTREEFDRVLKACEKYPGKRRDVKAALRIRALALLLRYSGLRISDAVTLSKQQVEDGVVNLRTAKTGTPVRVPLPKIAVDALDALPAPGGYYFWSGRSKKKSCVGDYQRAFKRLYEIAGVKDGHAHRWRDTFAVELLLANVPLEQVSILLGHRSIKVTEKHYAPFVPARQQQLEAAVRSTFEPYNSATVSRRGPYERR